MTTLAVRHTVQDFDVWKAAFDAHAAARRGHGATGHRVLRDGQDIGRDLLRLRADDA